MNVSTILPIERYVLISKLPPEEVKRRIQENVESRNRMRFSLFPRNNSKPYQGIITGDSFQMSRIINYRNSFLPVIKGEINGYFGRTEIRIKMRMAIAVIIFMWIWLGIIGLLCLFLLIDAVFNYKEFKTNGVANGSILPFVMFAFGWCLMLFAFKYESKKSKQFLSSLLDGEARQLYNQILSIDKGNQWAKEDLNKLPPE